MGNSAERPIYEGFWFKPDRLSYKGRVWRIDMEDRYYREEDGIEVYRWEDELLHEALNIYWAGLDAMRATRRRKSWGR